MSGGPTLNTLVYIIVVIAAIIIIILLLKFMFQIFAIGPIGFEDGFSQMDYLRETWLTSHS